MGDRKGQENDFINKAGEFNYDPFLNPNLYFASPFIRSPPRSDYTERKLSKRIGAIFFHFFGDEERRYRQARAIFIISL